MRWLTQFLLLVLATFSEAGATAIFGSGFEPPFNVPGSAAEAARFLTQASFGPTPQDIARVQAIGYVGWLNQQFALPPTRARPHLEQIAAGGVEISHNHRMDRWFHTVVYAPDQLRQRMAYALSQILVVSDRDSSLSSDYFGVAEYWDLLATHAFGNYRELMRAVSLSPQMARYLTFLRNRKGDPATGRLPDENYARELMQLFTIGLIERNDDFSPVLDAQGRPIPTYDQRTIMELARVFTGFTYAGSTSFFSGSPNYLPMICFQSQHDDQPKEIFGIRLLSGQCLQDLEEALDILFYHPNTPPFVARQLIQRFVTSNPSPQYIARVVAVFKNNGRGVRGDLRAVLEAILLDPEARQPAPGPGYGKPREPLLKLTALWRAFEAQPPPTDPAGFVPMGVRSPQNDYAQRPLGAPTVFNFYEPDYRPAGPIAEAGLVAPEFQIIDENYIIRTANHLYTRVWSGYQGMSNPPSDRPLLNLAPVASLANDPAAMVELLDLRLTYGTMSPGLRDILQRMIAELPGDGLTKARAAIQIVTLSPDFAVQR